MNVLFKLKITFKQNHSISDVWKEAKPDKKSKKKVRKDI